MYNGFSIDTEADGFIFEVKNLWVINLEDLDQDKKLQIHPFKDPKAKEKFLSWMDQYEKPNISFHNGLGYDIFVLFFILGIEFTVGPDTVEGRDVNFVDTFYLSMFLNPDREANSIEYFGQKFHMPKIDFREELINIGALDPESPEGAEFSKYHPLMDTYCERDTYIGKLTFIDLVREWKDMYGYWDYKEWPAFFRAGQKAFYLMSCQELTGWKFDVEKAKALQTRIEGMMEEIRAQVEPELPPRSLKKTEEAFYKMPAKPFKKDGSYSSHWEKFVVKHSGVAKQDGSWLFYDKVYSIEGGKVLEVTLPMEMANQDQMKDWFLSIGWEPTLFNFKRDANGKPERDPKTRKLIHTTPKLQEQGKLCPNLERLEGDLVKKVIKWLSLRNRLSVLTGWLNHPRLAYDGRIGAGRTGIAATHRQKHRVVVNVPKADPKVLLGYEFRELWIADEGMLIAAGDAAALEGRVQGHYAYKYDQGITAEELLKGDVHSKNCMAFYGDIYEEVASLYTSPDFDKEDPRWKPYRSKSKNGFYCLPMHTKVLTCSGWKLYDEIVVGEALPTFNATTGVVELDTVIKRHHFTGTEVFKFSNKNDSFQCTGNHRWYGWRRSKSSKGSKNIYGYFEAKDFTQEHNLILTAPFSGNTGCSDITVKDAKFMGYLLSDGSFTWSKLGESTSASFGKRKAVAMQITQSRNKFWVEIQNLIDTLGFKYCMREEEKENGNHVLHWKISQPDARSWLDRVVGNRLDKHKVNWTEWVMKLNRECLEAFYEGFYNGDGDVCSKSEVISQNTGKIHEAVVAAMQLIGKGRVTINSHSSHPGSHCQGIRMQKRKHLTMQQQVKVSLGHQDTFCLTTGNGSFIIWQDDFIGITGNCILYGGGASKVASTLGIPDRYGKQALDAFWEANLGTSELKTNLELYWENKGKGKYLPAIDGRILLTRKKSALLNTIFQSCGGIAMDYACCFLDSWLGGLHFDRLRRPYYQYKGYIVKRIGYFHDEVEFECSQDIAQEVAGLIEKAITKAGDFLKIKVPLEGEGKVGKNWKEVH